MPTRMPIARGRRRRLWTQKERIEALLPLVEPERASRMRQRLKRIHYELGIPQPDKPYAEDYYRADAAAAGVDGVGGLRFDVNAPPGVGRLVRVPLYLEQLPPPPAVTPVVTDGGLLAPAVENSLVIVGPVGARATGPMVLRSRPIEWADLRIVGFQASQRVFGGSVGAAPPPPPPAPGAQTAWPRPMLVVKNLSVGGGASLFPQIDYVDATIYSPRVPELAGLRDYSLLESPNTASVSAAVLATVPPGPPSGAPAMTFSCNLVCEILDDTGFGAHIPGPYARRGALERNPNTDGQTYLVGEGIEEDDWVLLPANPRGRR